MTELFSSPKIVIVGFSFNSDIEQFSKSFPTMKFYKYIQNFIDAQTYYGIVYKDSPMTGLTKVAKAVLEKGICKREQMSNWEKRPLRLSQQHYGALDAYVLTTLIEIMSIEGEKQVSLSDFKRIELPN